MRSTEYSKLIAAVISFYCTWMSIEARVNGTESLASSFALDHMRRHESLLKASSISYAIVQVANRSSISNECYKHLIIFKENILHKKSWAMKALDASGTKQAGFIYRNYFWLGSGEVCETVNVPLRLRLVQYLERIRQPDLIDDVAPFEFNYNVAMLQYKTSWQIDLVSDVDTVLHVGLCLPTSCTRSDIQKLMEAAMQKESHFITAFYELNEPAALYIKDLKLKDEFFQRGSLKIVVVLLIFTSAMILIGSIFDTKSSGLRKSKEITSNANGISVCDNSKENSSYEGILSEIKSFINCFNIHANWHQLFARKPSHNSDIPVINGVRTISAFAILYLHIVFFMFHKINNLIFLLSLDENTFKVGHFPVYLVDSFFTIGAFLQTSKFLKNTQQMQEIRKNTFMQNSRKFFKMLCHRYLRLAPLYFVVIAVTDLLVAYLNDVSVFHVNDRFHETCPRNWWHNVLFIQSFFGIKELCASWTWSLSCEMLYFVVATQLLFVYTKHPKLIKNVVIALLLVNIVGSLLIGVSVRYQFSFEAFYLTAGATYINPFVRALPYIVGSIAAWYFVENKCKLNISPFAEKFLWKFSAFLLATVTYTAYWRDLGYLCSMSLFMLGHSMVAVAICWLILASATGRSTAWSRFLEAPVFQHVNRLTYAIYLLNPVIINLIASLNESSAHMNISMLIIYCMGFSVLVYLVSIVFSLAFEMPYCNWSSLIQSRNKTKSA